MMNIFKKDPKAKLNKEYLALLEQAMNAQRNGDIKAYSNLTEKAETIKTQIDKL